MTESQLLARARAGDAAALRALYDAHVDRIHRLAYRMCGDEDLAQDLVQDTFIRAFSRLDTFRGEAAWSTWLHAIAVSVILNGLRRRKRFRAREADLEEASSIGTTSHAAQPDLAARLREAIDGLPEKYRLVFVMHEVEGFTHEEIGAALDMEVGTSKARLSRARAKLRERLQAFAPMLTQHAGAGG